MVVPCLARLQIDASPVGRRGEGWGKKPQRVQKKLFKLQGDGQSSGGAGAPELCRSFGLPIL